MPESWVINASPIILLAKAGLIQHVPDLVAGLVIPEPVALEILSGRGPDPAATWLKQTGKVFVRSAVAELGELSGTGIGPGERAVISWAAAHSGFAAVLDDLEARRLARGRGGSKFSEPSAS